MSLRRLTGLCCVLVVLTAVILARVYWVGTDTTYMVLNEIGMMSA